MADHRWLIERFGVTTRVVGAPMAGVGHGRLAAAVSAAGGIGTIGVGPFASGEWIATECAVASEPGRAFGVGLMGWSLPGNMDQLQATIEARPALVSVSFGPYDAHVGPLQEADIAVTTQVATADEARAAEQAGVDFIVSRGGEGGGHGRDEVGTLVLLQAVLDAVDLPVLAAGGIAGARGLAAVLAAGACGAWVGTAFLACTEAESSATARARIFAADETDTAYGRVFDIAQRLDWPPEFGGRALRNPFFDRWVGNYEALQADQGAVDELRAARGTEDFDTAYIYAGQGVGLLSREQTAAEVVAEFAGADERLRRAASGNRRGMGATPPRMARE
jgi:nitronate monooxygenase